MKVRKRTKMKNIYNCQLEMVAANILVCMLLHHPLCLYILLFSYNETVFIS